MIKKFLIGVGKKVVNVVERFLPEKDTKDDDTVDKSEDSCDTQCDESCDENECHGREIVRNACVAFGFWYYAVMAMTFPVVALATIWIISDQLDWDWSRKFVSSFPQGEEV